MFIIYFYSFAKSGETSKLINTSKMNSKILE
jgi:hypothetical protein